MEETSFKRAILFGIVGALATWVLVTILLHFVPSLKGTLFFKTQNVGFDLLLVAIQLRISLVMALGFIGGVTFCLLYRRPRKRA